MPDLLLVMPDVRFVMPDVLGHLLTRDCRSEPAMTEERSEPAMTEKGGHFSRREVPERAWKREAW